MRRVIASVLASALVFGMGVTAFAQWTDSLTFTAAAADVVENVQVGGELTATVDLADLGNALDATVAGEQLDSFVTQSDKWEIHGFTVASATAGLVPTVGDVSFAVSGDSVTATVQVPARAEAGDIFNVTFHVQGIAADVVNYTYADATDSDTLKAGTGGAEIAFDFTGVVIADPATPAPVPPAHNAKVTDFAANMSLAYGLSARETGRYKTYDLGTVIPHNEVKVRIDLLAEMFNIDGTGALTSQIVRNSKISVRTQVAAGSKALDATTIKYDGGAAYIEVKFVKEFVSTKALDFEFTTYLLINNTRKGQDGQGVTFTGTLENHEILVYSGDDYVDLSLGEVAHAQDFVQNIEVDLGSGVSVHTKFFKDKKYYGTASRDADEAADVVFSKYPDVDNVIILKTVGLNSTGDVVQLDTDFSDYYVYDSDLNYLGQSNTRLPYSSRYYLANRKLDIVVDDDSDEPVDDDDSIDPESGNSNANPGTGR